jgi:cytochrome c-type biogenesis protein CcmH
MRVLLLILTLLTSLSVQGAIDAYQFEDDVQRDRYHALIDELRCPQCLNTNLAGSDAMIAQDLRREVHRLVLEGHTDAEILDFMYERYGDFILYEPRVNYRTFALWFGPLLLLLLAFFVGWRVTRTPNMVAAELTAEEQAKLDQMLTGNAQHSPPPQSEK